MDRRAVLRTSLAAAAGSAAAGTAGSALIGAPAFARSGRPELTYGVQSGDITPHSAVLWTRADRPGRMLVEVSARPDFRGARHLRGPVLTSNTDLTGHLRLVGLPSADRRYYRVTVDADHGQVSEPVTGSFATVPGAGSFATVPGAGSFATVPGHRRGARFVWSADLAGQGWGINPDFGGFRIFEAMRRPRPDFFLCSGDTIYADNPIPAAQALPDGSLWKNLTTPAKSKVAETLDEYCGQYAYNLLDANLRAFAAEVPQLNQWDDHEVRNNWFPGQILDDPRYTEKRVDVLAARARQAFFEWTPITPGGKIYRRFSYGPHLDVFLLDMRTYKDPNDPDTYTDPARGMLGREQREWLIRELSCSRATWKIIANDLPLGLIVRDGPTNIEAVAQGDNGAPLGRELEFAQILRTAHQRGVSGLVFLTADVHYTATHHYDPARAAIGDFTPFWEFVSGPLNAGAFGPNTLDGTFGPRAEFVHAPPHPNAAPSEGFQHFGEVDIDGPSGDLTVRLRDGAGTVLWSTTLEAA